ncbi:MAG: beta-glucosidase [Chloroflexota bacterium]|nr:MAG: beta-glucosidase [Chloroflexota bacterium]
MNFIQFPKGFLWGSGTSAYQIEGGWNADGKGESIWDRWCHTPGHIKNNDTGDVACDHYHRWEEDVDLMARLGLKSYRFSISWPRVLPAGRGALNQPGLDFYDRLVDRLLLKGIQPCVTLFHWDLPQALQDEGGWIEPGTIEAFGEYTALMVRHLGDRVKLWATLNEPGMGSFAGYQGIGHPPGVNDFRLSLQVAHNLMLAHGAGVQALRAERADAQAGIVIDFWPVDPVTGSNADRQAAELFWQQRFTWFLDPLLRGAYPPLAWEAAGADAPKVGPGDFELMGQRLDWMGVNYYSRILMSAEKGRVREIAGAEYTGLNWEIHPQSLYRLLMLLKDEYPIPPLYIAENGAAFPDELATGEDGQMAVHDEGRTAYLRAHFIQAHQAMQAGVDLRGYFVWSLLDNFEWLQGYAARFGIVFVDYPTQRRVAKDSALWYARVIARNGLEA